MNPLRQKLAAFLIKAKKRGIDSLGPDSPYAEELRGAEAERIIREDVGKICESISIAEISRIFLLAARLKDSSKEKSDLVKDEFKRIAKDVVARAEDKFGKLKTPEHYRRLLWEL